MSTIVNLHHIVFRTYCSKPTIPNGAKRLMFKYIVALCESQLPKWHLVQVNSYLNHVHILIDIPSTMSVAEVARKIKSNTSRVFKHHPQMPQFEGWAKRYGSFSVSARDKMVILNYIRQQEQHHSRISFDDEIRNLFSHNGMDAEEFLTSEK